MADGYFSKHLTRGQSARERPPAGTVACRALLFALVMVATSCTSIYHRTLSSLSADPATEVELRLTEARRAEDQAGQAGRKLLANFREGKADLTISTDFDRLEAAGFELERRTLAARDAGGRNGDHAEVTAEIERLLQRAQAWLTYLEAYRSAVRAAQIVQLETLIASPAGVRGRSE